MTKILFTLLAALICFGCEKQALTRNTAIGEQVSKIHVIDATTGQCIRIEEGGIAQNEYTYFIVATKEECRP